MKNKILFYFLLFFFISCSNNKYYIFSISERNEYILFILGLLDDYAGHHSTNDSNKICAEFYKDYKNQIYYFDHFSRIILKDRNIKESLRIKKNKIKIYYYNNYLKQLINSYFDLKLHYSSKKNSAKKIVLIDQKIYNGSIRKDFLESLTFEEGKILLAGIFVDRYINNQLHIYSLTYTFEYLNNKYEYFKYKRIFRPEGIKGWIPGDPEHFIIYNNKVTVDEIQEIGNLLIKKAESK